MIYISKLKFLSRGFCQEKYEPTQSSGGLNSKYDLIKECENDVKLPNVLFGGEKKTKVKQTDFQRVHSEEHL